MVIACNCLTNREIDLIFLALCYLFATLYPSMELIVPNWLNLPFMSPTFTSSDGTVWLHREEAEARDWYLAWLSEVRKPSRILEALQEFDIGFSELSRLTGINERHLRYVAAGRRGLSEKSAWKFVNGLVAEDERRRAWRTPKCLLGLVQ
jgi:hypothetical protein